MMRDPLRYSREAKLTVLSFSAGTGSSAIAWLVMDGVIERPENFVVITADPGMENSETYAYAKMMQREFDARGIEWYVAEGPNLYEDLLNNKNLARLDNPPYFTKSPEGKRGRLRQACTNHYKIAPMDRKVRVLLEDKYGISRKSKRLGANIVNKWIGFSYDEVSRIKEAKQQYVKFSYPLVDLRYTKKDLDMFYELCGWPKPPRSVCNACFANDLAYYREMAKNRPQDWKQAVAVDDAVRDLSSVRVKEPVYVSSTLLPLRKLEEQGFVAGESYEPECHSGHCFV